ncbi:MAG: hypothetical protein EOO43_07225 [Flavobacterium sp.]|nr:MAG: hypothetical protein EOO43_07225 [Flavobacterium sp.]
MPRGNLILLAIIVTLSPTLIYIVFTLLAFNYRFRQVRPSLSAIDFSLTKPLFLLSVRFFIVQLTALMIYASANVLITNLFEPKEVIVYNLAYTIFNAAILVMSLCLSPVWSAVTDAYHMKDFIFLKKTLKRLNYLSLIFSIGIAIILIFSNYIYWYWLHGKVIIPFNMSLSMAIYAVVFMFQAPYSIYVNGMGKMKMTTSLSVAGIVIYFFSAVTISKYINSSAGVILGITLSSIIGLIVQRIQVTKLLAGKATGIWNV